MDNTWRGFMVAAVAAAWLAVPGAVQSASAALLTGDVEMSTVPIPGSGVRYDTTANTIQFPVAAQVDSATGSFAGAVFPGTLVLFQQGVLAPISYTTLTGPLIAQPGSGFAFRITGFADAQELGGISNALILSGNGILSLNGFEDTPGQFAFTTQFGGDGETRVSFSLDTRAVPGPIVGAGLPGLVIACGGLLALARRRRQQVAA